MSTDTETNLHMTPPATEEEGTLSAEEQQMLLEHHYLIERVVQGMRSKLAVHADLEELKSVGVTGLLSAVQNYDRSQQATFKGYAVLKIRGAILDELRRMDWMTRSSRKQLKTLQQAVGELEQKLGRTPTDEELRSHLKMSPGEFRKLLSKTRTLSFISLDYRSEVDGEEGIALHEKIADETQERGFQQMEKEELTELLSAHLEQLPERQKKVLAFYYLENLKLSEIATLFEVTEARICQIHTQALARLKQELKAYR